MLNNYERKKLSNGSYGMYKDGERFATISKGWDSFVGVINETGFRRLGNLREVTAMITEEYSKSQESDTELFSRMKKEIDDMQQKLGVMSDLINDTKTNYDLKYKEMLSKKSLLIEKLMEKSDVK